MYRFSYTPTLVNYNCSSCCMLPLRAIAVRAPHRSPYKYGSTCLQLHLLASKPLLRTRALVLPLTTENLLLVPYDSDKFSLWLGKFSESAHQLLISPSPQVDFAGGGGGRDIPIKQLAHHETAETGLPVASMPLLHHNALENHGLFPAIAIWLPQTTPPPHIEQKHSVQQMQCSNWKFNELIKCRKSYWCKGLPGIQNSF